MYRILVLVIFVLLFFTCGNQSEVESTNSINTAEPVKDELPAPVATRLEHLLNYPVNAAAFPRSVNPDGTVFTENYDGWTTGFPPGVLWIAYDLSRDERYKTRAEQWTEALAPQQFSTNDHDVGFQINCSYGEGYRLTKDTAYARVIINAAKSLSQRYDERVGAIRSWDWNAKEWSYPVIIDNMMNLELLYEASELSGDTSFAHIANRHALTTMANHFREDNSTYHVVDYDPNTGRARGKVTHQGYSDDSAWARGQAWGLYGYTMAYARMGDERFREQAEKIARFLLTHRRPMDGIPYWDYDAPDIPNAPRDASAAAVMASAYYQLATLVTDGSEYREMADALLYELGNKYLVPADEEVPFILDHSTGHMPNGTEIDVPINYADYYFMEALRRRTGDM